MHKQLEKPWRMRIAAALLVLAFLLLFLVGISLPIIKPIHLVTFQSTSSGPVSAGTVTKIRFGVWGVCAYSDSEVGASQIDGLGYCVGPLFKYIVTPQLKAQLGIPENVVKTIEAAVRTVLILHPIVALLALIVAFPFCIPGPLNISPLTLNLALGGAILAGLLGTVIFGIELALPILGRRRIANLLNFDFSVQFGNGVWMVFVAFLCLWTAAILIALLKRALSVNQGVQGEKDGQAKDVN